jgi:hypothetical protein
LQTMADAVIGAGSAHALGYGQLEAEEVHA